MTYTATISSQGQVTIPVEARRKLGLTKRVNFDIRGDKVYITPAPTIRDAWNILDAPSKGRGLSKREKMIAEQLVKKSK